MLYNAGDVVDVAGTAISIAYWCKSSSGFGIHVSKYLDGGSKQYATYQNSDDVFSAQFPDTQLSSGSFAAVSSWRHIVFSYDGSNVRIYGNGSLLATHAWTGSMPNTSQAFALGGNYDGGSVQYGFTGDLADVGIWNRALTSGEAASLAGGDRAETITSGLVEAFRLLSGSTGAETGVNGTVLSVAGTVGSAADPPTLDPPPAGDGQPPRSMHQYRLRRAA